MSSQGDFSLAERRIGEAMVLVQRRRFSKQIARYTDMTEVEVSNYFRDRESQLIQELRGECPVWIIRLVAQRIIVEAIIERLKEPRGDKDE